MKLKWMLPVLLVAASATIGKMPAARAMLAAPMTRVFSNESGQVMLKVVPDKDLKATATLTRFSDDGTEKVIWTTPLNNLPGRVFVSNNWEPYVVTTDSWANAGGEHSIVVYDPKGKVIADFKGDDFLPKLPEPPAPKPGEMMVFVEDGGGRNWSMNSDISFEPRWNPTHFVVQLYDGEAKPVAMQTAEGTLTGAVRKRGEQIRIDLKTGELTRLTGAQIVEANAAAKIAPPLQVMPVEAGGNDGLVVRGGNDIATGQFGTGPGDDHAGTNDTPKEDGAVAANATLAQELRAVPEAANDVKISAELWRDMMPQAVIEGQKPTPRPLMLVVRLQPADGKADGKDAVTALVAEKVWVVRAANAPVPLSNIEPSKAPRPGRNEIWSAPLTKGDAGRWNAGGGPEWKPGSKVDVIVEVRSTNTGKTFRVRTQAEIIGAM